MQAQDFFSWGCEPEVDGRQRLSSEITTSKSAILHLVCVIIMDTIYEMYPLALRTASFLNAEAEFVVAGDVKRSAGDVSVTTS